MEGRCGDDPTGLADLTGGEGVPPLSLFERGNFARDGFFLSRFGGWLTRNGGVGAIAGGIVKRMV